MVEEKLAKSQIYAVRSDKGHRSWIGLQKCKTRLRTEESIAGLMDLELDGGLRGQIGLHKDVIMSASFVITS